VFAHISVVKRKAIALATERHLVLGACFAAFDEIPGRALVYPPAFDTQPSRHRQRSILVHKEPVPCLLVHCLLYCCTLFCLLRARDVVPDSQIS